MMKGAKSMSLDSGERYFWRLVHFWVYFDYFRSLVSSLGSQVTLDPLEHA